MWGGFQKVVQSVFSKAVIVIDRFHVMKLVNQAVNRIRLQLEIKGLKNRCLLLKNGEDLNESEKNELQQLLEKSAFLAIAYSLKEEFRSIYETSTTVKMGLRKMKKWLSYGEVVFGSTAQTIRRHKRSYL